MEGRFLLNVVIRQSAPILELFAGKNQTLLVWRDAFFVLDFGFDIVDSVAGLDLQSDGFTSQRFHKDLHLDCLSFLCSLNNSDYM